MSIFLSAPIAETLRSPTAIFCLLLAIALLIPPIFERLKLPGLVGLLAAGVLFGSNSLGWLDSKDETVVLLAEVGKLYLMFVAGLEIDIALFNKTRARSLSFGMLTFSVPFVSGVAVGLLFNFGWLAAVLIGSLLASHTLLAYPIIQRLGVVGNEAVTITVGATIFTDIAALVVLAICLGINQGNFTTLKLLILLGALALYAIAILFGLKQLAKTFFRITGKDEASQFLFVLVSLFIAAIGAQLVGVEGIIGAFLAGLAINSVLGDGPVKERIEFLGGALFIPMFFIDMGLLLDLSAFESLFRTVQVPLAIVGALIGSKFLASLGTKTLFGYSWAQTWTMWSLSMPQVAATLAAALVGYQAQIINAQVFNSVILMMLVTSVLGPLITAQSARHLAIAGSLAKPEPLNWLPLPDHQTKDYTFSIVVPVYNPKTERWLIELAAIVAQYEKGKILPLAVALSQPQMDSPQMRKAIAHCRRRLKDAELISQTFSIPLSSHLRIERGVPQAIYHLSREQNASLIMMGMRSPRTILGRRYVFNDIHQEVMWSAHCPVVVSRLLKPPAELKNILLPIENPSPLTIRVMRFAQVLGAANRGRVVMIHVCSPFSSESHRTRLQQQLEALIAELPASDCTIEVQVLIRESIVATIAKAAQNHDVVVLRSQRRRTSPGFNLSSLTPPLVSKIQNSVILVGEPHPTQTKANSPRQLI